MRIGNYYFSGNKKRNEIALTFDDGPSNETLEILKLLKRYEAKATFFVLGKRIAGNESILRKTIKEGHEIGNHSWNHPKFALLSKKKAKIELDLLDNELKKYKVKNKLFRPPYLIPGLGIYSACKDKNKKIIMCNINPSDWNKKNSKEKVVKEIIKKTRSGAIVDLHDYTQGIGKNEKIVSIIEEILPILSKKYKLVTISQLLKG